MNKLEQSLIEMLCKLNENEFEQKTGHSLSIGVLITMAQAGAKNLKPNEFYKQSSRKDFDRKKKEQLDRRCYCFDGE